MCMPVCIPVREVVLSGCMKGGSCGVFWGCLKGIYWVFERVEKGVRKGGKRGDFAKRSYTLELQMELHFCGIEGVKNTPISTQKVRIMPL